MSPIPPINYQLSTTNGGSLTANTQPSSRFLAPPSLSGISRSLWTRFYTGTAPLDGPASSAYPFLDTDTWTVTISETAPSRETRARSEGAASELEGDCIEACEDALKALESPELHAEFTRELAAVLEARGYFQDQARKKKERAVKFRRFLKNVFGKPWSKRNAGEKAFAVLCGLFVVSIPTGVASYHYRKSRLAVVCKKCFSRTHVLTTVAGAHSDDTSDGVVAGDGIELQGYNPSEEEGDELHQNEAASDLESDGQTLYTLYDRSVTPGEPAIRRRSTGGSGMTWPIPPAHIR